MTGLEITALSVVSVVAYVSAMGVTRRLLDPQKWNGCQYPPWELVCAVWPLAATMWLTFSVGRAIYLPLAATFRVCAGLNRGNADV